MRGIFSIRCSYAVGNPTFKIAILFRIGNNKILLNFYLSFCIFHFAF
jgi:hypothetical protein